MIGRRKFLKMAGACVTTLAIAPLLSKSTKPPKSGQPWLQGHVAGFKTGSDVDLYIDNIDRELTSIGFRHVPTFDFDGLSDPGYRVYHGAIEIQENRPINLNEIIPLNGGKND